MLLQFKKTANTIAGFIHFQQSSSKSVLLSSGAIPGRLQGQAPFEKIETYRLICVCTLKLSNQDIHVNTQLRNVLVLVA
jgi:hypothetical protein